MQSDPHACNQIPTHQIPKRSTVWKPSKHSLFTILQKRSDELKPPPEPEPPPPPPPEPPPDPKAKGKGGKEPPKKK
jgi:hypothetical protein